MDLRDEQVRMDGPGDLFFKPRLEFLKAGGFKGKPGGIGVAPELDLLRVRAKITSDFAGGDLARWRFANDEQTRPAQRMRVNLRESSVQTPPRLASPPRNTWLLQNGRSLGGEETYRPGGTPARARRRSGGPKTGPAALKDLQDQLGVRSIMAGMSKGCPRKSSSMLCPSSGVSGCKGKAIHLTWIPYSCLSRSIRPVLK